MAKEYDNTNRGALFRNDRKESDNHPDYTGTINVGGTDFWLSAWIKDGRSGKFMSLSIKPKESRERNPVSQSQDRRGSMKDQLDDDLPF